MLPLQVLILGALDEIIRALQYSAHCMMYTTLFGIASGSVCKHESLSMLKADACMRFYPK